MTRDNFILQWEKINKMVYNLIRLRTRSLEDANDVYQNTALYAYEHMNDLRVPSSFQTWVTRIALNEAKLFYRGKGKVPVDYSSIKNMSNYKPDEYITTRLTVMEFIHTLREEDRKLLMMKYFYGLSLNEIAQATGEKYASLYYRLSKAGKQIDKYLYSTEEGEDR